MVTSCDGDAGCSQNEQAGAATAQEHEVKAGSGTRGATTAWLEVRSDRSARTRALWLEMPRGCQRGTGKED